MRVLLALLLFCGFVTHALAQTLNPGDTLQISVLQDPKLDRTVVVSPDGTIAFPLAGHIQAGGRTPQAVESTLRSRLAKNYTGKLDVTVSLAAVNQEEENVTKPRVYVTGEVLKPGYYFLRPKIHVVEALALAGGLGPFAASKRIQVHRQVGGADTISLFNYDAYQSGQDIAGNIDLQPGDVVVVPERKLFE
jgi:polysaccharide export outer membrane protein